MEYQFMIDLPYLKAEEVMEKLAIEGFFNTYFDKPIEVTRNENRYAYKIEETRHVCLYVISESASPESTVDVLSKLLEIERDKITYQQHGNQDWQQTIPIIPINESWEIISPGHKPVPLSIRSYLIQWAGSEPELMKQRKTALE
ncbi:hypothetical protein ACJROX_16160 [Pseudalkalibacillus sp. A8]|uniref:hypothetical protein n=1 Tax=Pseudalkalibacillus sp. A8 TaxID=3382641 RepID=UPI0038B5115E